MPIGLSLRRTWWARPTLLWLRTTLTRRYFWTIWSRGRNPTAALVWSALVLDKIYSVTGHASKSRIVFVFLFLLEQIDKKILRTICFWFLKKYAVYTTFLSPPLSSPLTFFASNNVINRHYRIQHRLPAPPPLLDRTRCWRWVLIA